MNEIFDLIDDSALIADCEYLQQNPETGFELLKTLSYVENELKKYSIEYERCGKAGICAYIGDKNLSKTLLLRADMDALPSSAGENMHLCGHHMHTAMLLGAARAIKSRESMLSCRVKLMFQPAEEILAGAKDMIDAGILENPNVDWAFMLHCAASTDFDSGTVIFASSGDIAPSADYFDIVVKGKSSHGSEPSKGFDPISAGAHVICALQNINARELSLKEDAVITLGKVVGGSAPNAIADELKIQGTMRTYSEETTRFVKKRIEDISKGVASALRTSADVCYTHGCPPFKNDGVLLEKVSLLAKDVLGKKRVIMLPDGERGGGSEDFAYVSRLVPTVMGVICAGRKDEGYNYPLHNVNVRFDKKALPYGSALMTYLAFNLN